MKLYIAGPMTGYPEFNYPAFNAAAERLQRLGFETLNPVDSEQHNPNGEPMHWSWYMRHALRMVVDADGIALLPHWEHSRGARLEQYVAEQLGLPNRPLAVWLTTPADRIAPTPERSRA